MNKKLNTFRAQLAFAMVLCLLVSLIAPVAVSAAGSINTNTGATALRNPDNPPVLNVEEHIQKQENGFELYSPNKSLALHVYEKEDGKLYYRVERNGKNYMMESRLGLTVAGVDFGADATVGEPQLSEINRNFTLLGKQKDNVDHCVLATVPVTASNGAQYTLLLRAYDNGIALSYDVPAETATTSRAVTENTQFVVPDGTTTWAAIDTDNYANYETIITQSDPKVPQRNSSGQDYGLLVGVTFDLPGEDGYSAILEGDMNTSYPGTSIAAKGDNVYQIRTSWTMGASSVTLRGSFVTPWRIVCVADDLNELVNNNIVYAVNEDPDETLFGDMDDRVIPGRSAWSWLNGGYPAVNPQNMKLYNELAARLGFEYNTIDDGWVFWGGGDKTVYDQQLYKFDLARVAEYGKQYGVNNILWSSMNDLTGRMPTMSTIEQVNAYLDLMEETGMAGGKLDFWPREDNLNMMNVQLQTLHNAAQRKLLMNLHGVFKPTGWDVTYPNEVTREGIRATEQVEYDENTLGIKFAPYVYYTTQPYTRYLQGHADFSPYARSAGEIGSFVFGDSPLNMIATDPADMLANPAVEMIKSIPTVWDKTYVLPDSEIGKATIFARQKDNIWYIGGVADSAAKDVNINFSEFLDGGHYLMEMWRDTSVMTSTGVGGSKEKTTATINANDTYPLTMIEHGGFVMRLTKLELSQYGGEIKDGEPLEIRTPSADSVVKYTLDGSDPATSSTAQTYSSPIALQNSCTFRATIVSGDGTGTTVKHLFNLIDENGRLKSDLKDALEKAKAYTFDEYTDESYNNLQAAVQVAQAQYDDPSATAEGMKTACNNLLTAISKMVKRSFRGIYSPSLQDLTNWDAYDTTNGTSLPVNGAVSAGGKALTADFGKLDGTSAVVVDDAATKLVNGVLEFDTTVTETDSMQIILRFKDNQNYMALARNGNTWELHQVTDGQTQLLGSMEEGEGDVHFTQDVKHRVKVMYNGKKLDLYIDGVQIGSIASDSMVPRIGTYGFGHAAGTASQKISFENLILVDADYYQNVIVSGDLHDLPLEGMTATAGSQQNSTSNAAQRVLDNDSSTIWHTRYSDPAATRDLHWLVIDLNGSKTIDGVRYLPRQTSTNGEISKYAIDASNDDGKTYTQVAMGYWDASSRAWKNTTFTPVEATHIRLRSLESLSDTAGKEFTTAAEIHPTLFDPTKLPDEDRIIPPSQMTATAGSQQSTTSPTEGPARLVLDDKPDTIWHTSWNGTTKENLYITLALGGSYMVDGYWYLPRQSGTNGKIYGYIISVSTDGTNFTEVASGTWPSGSIDWQKVSFDPVEATHIKLQATSSGTDGSGKFFASAAEIRVIGDRIEQTDKTALQALYNEYKDTANNNYTETSWNTFQSALTEAKRILDKENATQEEVDAAANNLQAAHEGLEQVVVDKGALEALYNECKEVENDNYTEDSWQAFQNALGEAKTVLDNGDATQEQVNTATGQLQTAYDGLTKQTGPGDVEVESVKINLGALTNLKYGKPLQLDVSINPSDATNKELTFTSSNNNVLTVDADGVVTGVKPGTARVTATAHNGVSHTVTIRVTA